MSRSPDHTDLQALLDQEAQLSNEGHGNTPERSKIHMLIRLMRDETQRPGCFGEDDCSTLVLSQCPWRMDCGAEPYYDWGG